MKKITSIILSICMLLSVMTGIDITAFAETYSGKCGANLTWTLDTTTGVLSIKGKGAMYDYTDSDSSPWRKKIMIWHYIKTVNISSGVTSIGDYAFFFMENLQKVTLSNTVKSIGKLAFKQCYGLTSVNLPDSLTRLGDGAFCLCDNLKSIKIPDSVKELGAYVFQACSSLETANIPYGITELEGCFDNCQKLKSIVIPDTVKTIGENAFANCDSLKSINIPNSVTTIGVGAFHGCDAIKNITIPSSVTEIGGGAFGYMNIESIVIPDSVKSMVGATFIECKKLKNVTLPKTLTKIGQYMFNGCESLNSIILPENTQSIEKFAFCDCNSLMCITIPKSVKSVEARAFSNCKKLSDVYYTGTADDWSKININSDNNECLINAAKHYGSHLARVDITKATLTDNGKIVTTCAECGKVLSTKTIARPKTFTLSTTKYTYDGKEKKPSVKVTNSNGKTISSSNYTVSYAKGRKTVGKYAVTITFKSNYSGKKTVYFTIVPKSTSISKLTAGSKKITVKLNKNTTQTTGYQLQYATNSKFNSAKSVSIKNTTTSKTLKSLKGNKKYYVRVRTYKTINGTKYYSTWSKSKSITTKK